MSEFSQKIRTPNLAIPVILKVSGWLWFCLLCDGNQYRVGSSVSFSYLSGMGRSEPLSKTIAAPPPNKFEKHQSKLKKKILGIEPRPSRELLTIRLSGRRRAVHVSVFLISKRTNHYSPKKE